ncbi:MAG: aminopeptidase N [Mariprofundus sp.]|nr:aminopeptidase N [Mariprofundus sp.]
MAKTIYLKDYQRPSFLVERTFLDFSLLPSATTVISRVCYQRNPLSVSSAPLLLDGHDMVLLSVKLDGRLLSGSEYQLSESSMQIDELPDQFELEITTRLNPQANSSLEGLYRSGGNYCTQCEAEGFRKITYYQDRPDVMSSFTVRIEADKGSNPVLLSNGNPIGAGVLANGNHWAEWHDPFAKPCYLFALVAGGLRCVEDQFTTMSGRDVKLQIYTEAHHIEHCGHAMASLKRAMLWDEQRFALEYDLDLFMIVAVDDFNMGAMENKGLNVFNSRLVFASPQTATDTDYLSIEAVIGHEYFHNWTGNRVTCRDWFQLSLKEGLTVFRDQEFTADTHSHAVKRIEDVRMLRSHQFAEDAGPMAHPIRPASYMEINNFYTVTVYEKGAEVVRLYQSLLGIDGFRRGMDLYFKRHDGQAVTTEDFLAAMGDANGRDLSQMQQWYDQAGTPRLSVKMDYDAQNSCCTLHFQQHSPAPLKDDGDDEQLDATEAKPFLIPLELGLLLPDGAEVPLQLSSENEAQGLSRTLMITEMQQSFTFIHVDAKPLPSLLRGFSAPVELEYPYALAEQAFLMCHDSDSFNRWAAAQGLFMQTLLSMIADDSEPTVIVVEAFAALLADSNLDLALKAETLLLPSEADIGEACAKNPGEFCAPNLIHQARQKLRYVIATQLRAELQNQSQQLLPAQGLDDSAMQQRSLKNVCLGYLSVLKDESSIALVAAQFNQATNMTDQYAALVALADCDGPERNAALAQFEQQWLDDANVMDKWFSVQASSTLATTLAHVKSLMSHAKFDMQNPNKVRALIGTFAMRNPSLFHAVDGSGYAFIADQVLALNAFNPQVASRMVRALINWKRIEPVRSQLMYKQLQRIADSQSLSADVFEIVSKSLLTHES